MIRRSDPKRSARAARTSWQAIRAWALAVLAAGLTGCAHRPAQPFTFVQMCDPQLGFGGYEADCARFRQAVEQINDLKPDLVVICGDLVNRASGKTFADFNALRAAFHVPCYCAPGNHDLGNAPTRRTLARYRKWIGKDYYSFDHQGCTFVVVDSQLWKAPLPGASERQDTWLEKTLAAAAKRGHPIFVVMHYPLFVKEPDEPEGYYNLPREKRNELLALFERSGVQAILAGHTHQTIVHRFHGIQLVASETTSRNFDGQPVGFRLWRIAPGRPYENEFVPLRTPQ